MSIRRACISLLLIYCLILQPAPSFGSENTPEPAPAQELQPIAQQILSKDTLIQKFKDLGNESRSVQLLDGELRKLQFTPATEAESYWGQSITYQRTVGGSQEHLLFSVYVQDYVKRNSKDAAALGQVTLAHSTGETTTYSFYLLAPEGNVENAQEYAVANNEVKIQHSWWTCVKGQLKTAAGTCVNALASCALGSSIAGNFKWAVYLGCVAGACALAFVKAAACCACNGSSWCSWAVGSCSQGSSSAGKPALPPCTVWDPYTKKYVPCPPQHGTEKCSGQTTIDKQTMEELCCASVVNGACKGAGQWVKPGHEMP
jgi:hypothetical protein